MDGMRFRLAEVKGEGGRGKGGGAEVEPSETEAVPWENVARERGDVLDAETRDFQRLDGGKNVSTIMNTRIICSCSEKRCSAAIWLHSRFTWKRELSERSSPSSSSHDDQTEFPSSSCPIHSPPHPTLRLLNR